MALESRRSPREVNHHQLQKAEKISPELEDFFSSHPGRDLSKPGPLRCQVWARDHRLRSHGSCHLPRGPAFHSWTQTPMPNWTLVHLRHLLAAGDHVGGQGSLTRLKAGEGGAAAAPAPWKLITLRLESTRWRQQTHQIPGLWEGSASRGVSDLMGLRQQR